MDWIWGKGKKRIEDFCAGDCSSWVAVLGTPGKPGLEVRHPFCWEHIELDVPVR